MPSDEGKTDNQILFLLCVLATIVALILCCGFVVLYEAFFAPPLTN
jgi:hypothetical protein